uniref:Hypothetical chloroplast RF1 n=1 Tax=Fusochloris perforata TaxID=106203 RepID=A0A097KPU4_9CHLO|nr:hypothetical chloroplast RF1 [Fusochloris perforata]AIT95219.1 hypothetical chloroplast RF1 [Fusochloris perforata]
MSFVTSIRDYVELLNTFYDSMSGDLSVQKIIQHTLVYFFGSLKYIFIYFISFQWFRDLVYLPIIVPQLSLSVLKENFILDDSTSGIYSFFQTPLFSSNKFFIGFLNSFFLCLPLSCSNFLVFRRLLIQGVPAGLAAAFGSILSQCLFLASIFFGIRLFFLPWFSLDSFQYLFGLFLILAIVYSMSHEVQLTRIKSTAFRALVKIFSLNFLLGWTEQSCLFQYIGNLTVSSEPTILETINAKNQIDYFLIHISYLAGILVGSLFFSFCFGFLVYRFTFFLINFTGTLYSESIEKINFILITTILGLSLASIPFYALDYLITNPVGFVSQDKGLQNTFFSQSKLKEPLIGFTPEIAEYEPAADLALFDRGRYLERNTRNSSFEELNFEGEYAWKTKLDRQKAFSAGTSEDFFLKWIKNFKKSKQKLSPQEISAHSSEKEEEQREEQDFLRQNEKHSDFEKNELDSKNLTVGEELSNGSFDEINELDFIPNSKKEYTTDDFVKGELGNRIKNSAGVEALFDVTDNAFLNYLKPDESDAKNVALEKKIKQQFYSNPVYKKLLQTDIDSFLSRQPSEYFLSSAEEKDLFEKRLILANYYDSLRDYTQWRYAKQFQDIFAGSKSYSDRVYNQQFKGTSDILRRLFSITLEEEENQEKQRVLKYDQPLFNKTFSNKKRNVPIQEQFSPLLHEESSANPELNKDSPIKSKLPQILQKKPFLELTQGKPFYAGWDEKERKFVVTNRFLPRSQAGYFKKENINGGEKIDFKSNLKSVKFTAWPINPNENKSLPYTFLFDSLKPSDKEHITLNMMADKNVPESINSKINFDKFPTNFKMADKSIEFDSLFDTIAPKRGGFIWPGSASKIDFSFFKK